jgi:hypothetical protein
MRMILHLEPQLGKYFEINSLVLHLRMKMPNTLVGVFHATDHGGQKFLGFSVSTPV